VKQTVNKSNDRQRAVVTNSTARRKKLIVAFLLFFVMAVLWIRAFVWKGKPESASAALEANSVNTAAEPAALKVVYTELPVIGQRHDILANDFFSARNFKGFRKQGKSAPDSEVDMSGVPDRQSSRDLEAAAEEMELIAIVNDKRPQVFIEDKLLEKGQSFKFVFYGEVYEFKVINIMEDGVELECDGVIVTKKIPESFLKAD
jgi:hypothetical protein